MSQANPNPQRAYLALGFGILAIGLSPIFIRWANAPGVVSMFYRTGIAALALAWPFAQRVRKAGRLPRAGIWMAVLGGLFFAADLAAWSSGVMLSGATNPTLLANTAPVWVGLGAMLFFKEELNWKFWAGLLLALAGAILILGLDGAKAANAGLGSLLGLAAAIFYGGYFLFTQKGRESLDALSYFWIAALTTTIILFFASLGLGHSIIDYPLTSYINFLFMGLLVQVVGWMAITYAQGYLPASIVAPTLLIQPAIAGIAAVPLLGEALAPLQVLGGLAVLAGVLSVHRSRG